jgi:hypothetical protein
MPSKNEIWLFLYQPEMVKRESRIRPGGAAKAYFVIENVFLY